MPDKIRQLIDLAHSLIGRPYKYGARKDEAPEVFDCSLFTQYLFGKIGYDIPRSTIEQAEFSGKKVASVDDIQPGDLIFIKGDRGHYNPAFPDGIGHVAVYLGDGKIIHAVSKRIQHQPKIIEVGSIKIDPLDSLISELNPPATIRRVID